jgi:glycerate 2-kinase
MVLYDAARSMSEAALWAVEPGRLVKASVLREGETLKVLGESFDLAAYDNIWLIAFGKAAAGMAEALADVLDDRLTAGVVVTPPTGTVGDITRDYRLHYLEAAHPLPDERSAEAARRTLDMASKAGANDLILVCASGGASSLLCLPAEGVTLDEKKEVTQALLKSGATICELNVVRKHLSAIKGGRLALAATPASVVNLLVSDVNGDDPATIASGPTYWDGSTYADARDILTRYRLWEVSPDAVRMLIEAGLRGDAPETPKSGDPAFARVQTFVIGNNLTALRGARREAERLGFEPFILTSSDEGEARQAARDYVAFIAGLACSTSAAPKPVCLLAGGELTVSVKGRGKGGRNMEFVLAALVEIRKEGLGGTFCGTCALPEEGAGQAGNRPFDWLILSLGTDGIDGPTDAAGAWADAATLERVRELELDPAEALDANDSYPFFEKTGNLLITGPTGTNVCDVRIFLIRPA